jgi:class 3 adenylate cyclase/tetratricopeptide (TPR) repeat protein
MNDVAEWLTSIGLAELTKLFVDGGIELGNLHELTNEDLKDIGVARLADRKLLLKEIAQLAARKAQSSVERRLLSVLFCDLVGSTALSTRLDPEELREALRVYRETVVGCINRHRGFVASYMGDGVLAYFGWPYADEDQAAQAVRAGLEAVAAVPSLTLGSDLVPHCRVGIATGRVVVGGQSHLDSAVGETPNLAARLQALAAADEVVVDKVTHHAIGQGFDSEALAPVEVKGFAQAVEPWRISSERKDVERFDVRHGRRATFVGRDRDLELLLERWRQAQAGAAQTVVVEGEAGIGKSRLIREFESRVRERNPTTIRFQCSPFHTNSAFYPVIRHVEKAAGFDPRDESPSGKLAKVTKLFEASLPEYPHALSVLADVLSIPLDGAATEPPLSPLQRRGLFIQLLAADALRLAGRNALLVIVEDAHWMDPSSQELLKALVSGTRDAPVVVVVTARPRPVVPWPRSLGATQISLGRLEDRDVRAIARSVPGSAQLSEGDIERIVSRVDGIPLFAEEITSAALERAARAGSFDLPETIQASLAARLDSLGGGKDLAQMASVLGRQFKVSQLARLAHMPAAGVESSLSTLLASGLVQRTSEQAEATYRFKHALVQDVAYESLLKQRRRELHKQVFEEILDDSVKSREPEMAAHHLTEAGMPVEAIEYWKKAGQRAARASANAEAIAHFSRGMELIGKLPQGAPRDALEFSLRVGLTAPLIASKGYTSEELSECVAEALALSRKIGHTPELYSILYSRWGFLLTAGFMADACKIADEFSELAERQNDRDALYARYRMLGASHMCLGNLKQATSYLDEAIARYDPQQHARLVTAYGVDIGVAARCFKAEVRWLMGLADQAKAGTAQALEQAKRTQHVHTRALSLFFCGLLSFLCRDGPAVRRYIDELMHLASQQPIGAWPTLGRAMLGWARFDSGERDDGFAMLAEGVRAAQKLGVGMFMPFFLCRMAEASLVRERDQEAEQYLSEAETLMARTAEMNYRGEVCRLAGELLARRSHSEEAIARFEEALAVARAQSAGIIELRTATTYAEFLVAWDQPQRARAVLRPVLDAIAEGEATRDVRAARALAERLGA